MELAWLNRALPNYILLQHFRSFETTFIFGQTRRTVKLKKKQVCIIMQTKLQTTDGAISMWQKKKKKKISYKYRLV